jgi:hypothetical protein
MVAAVWMDGLTPVWARFASILYVDPQSCRLNGPDRRYNNAVRVL